MLLGVQGDLRMWWWLWGHAGFSYTEGWSHFPRASFPSRDRRGSIVWLLDHMLDRRLVFGTRLFGQMAENLS